MRSPQTLACGVVLLAMLGSAATAGEVGPRLRTSVPPDPSAELQHAVKLRGVVGHLRSLQRIADEHGGNRASGRPGYRASVRYIASELREAGYRPEVQAFEFEETTDTSALAMIAPATKVYTVGTDFIRTHFTPAFQGSAEGPVVAVDLVVPADDLPPNSNTSGCEDDDFADFPDGGIALVQRGSCDFSVKVQHAQDAGAAGVIVMNEGQPDRADLIEMNGEVPGLAIPVVFATPEVGEELAATPDAEVALEVGFDAETRRTWNVLAETRRGNHRSVVMAGAHLDSVAEGAGINDNGTGSAALLETAIRMRGTQPRQAVRFAWWGAEEIGLLGSEHYVAQLTKSERERIALYLNFDMIGSPNPITAIYDGDDSSDTAEPGTIPRGSRQIEKVFERFYTQRGERFEDSTFDGRSDYGPFIEVGIPAGGIFTGAEELKTARQARRYGGVAGAPLDPCYHEACDTVRYDGAEDGDLYDRLREDYRLIGNVNADVLDLNSDALAAAIARYAFGRIPFAR